MSGKATGEVWEFDLPQNEKLVCLALADHADHMGKDVRPSQALIAWKTGFSVRHVRRLIDSLVEKGAVVCESSGKAKGKPNTYTIDFENAPKLKPFREKGKPPKVGHPGVLPADDGSDIQESYPGGTSESPTGSDIQESDRTVLNDHNNEKITSEPVGPDTLPDQTSTDEAPKPPTPQQAMFEAICQAWGYSTADVTDTQRGLIGKVAKELVKVGAPTADMASLKGYLDIRARRDGWKQYTVVAMAKYWPDFLKDRVDGHKPAQHPPLTLEERMFKAHLLKKMEAARKAAGEQDAAPPVIDYETLQRLMKEANHG